MSITTEKQRITQQSLPSASWLRCFALSAMAITSMGVGLWRSHLLVEPSALALLLFFGIISATVFLGTLLVLVYRRYLDWQASTKMQSQSLSSDSCLRNLESKSTRKRKAAVKATAIAVMVGLLLLSILPIVALVKVSIVESQVRNDLMRSVNVRQPRAALAVHREFERLWNEHR